MISNENEFLGYLIEKSKGKGVYQSDSIDEGELSEFETIHYAKLLIVKGYITANLTSKRRLFFLFVFFLYSYEVSANWFSSSIRQA